MLESGGADRPEGGLEELARSFGAHRPRLHAIARRALGTHWDADDAVQETWIRLQRTDAAAIEDLEAWLTTVVSRVCIDLIRRSARRPEVPTPQLPVETEGAGDPAEESLASEELMLAMHLLLDELGPRERLAVILHDVFALPYAEIAPVVDRTPTAARRLASRARARLREVDARHERQLREGVVEAFLAASRNGEFGALLQLLDPEIELRSDAEAVAAAAAGRAHGAPPLEPVVRGADAVARVFAGRMQEVAMVLLAGVPAAVYPREGPVQALYLLHVGDGRLRRIEALAGAEHLSGLLRDAGVGPVQEA